MDESDSDGLYHSPLFDHIRRYFENLDSKRNTIFVFAPYIKTDVLSKLLSGLNSRMVVITTWKPRDIQVGSSELKLYPYCRDQNISLYLSKNLHLKVYSVNLESVVLATGNVSRRGLLPEGNYEAGILVKHLTSGDRLFFEQIRQEAVLVNDAIYEDMVRWADANKMEPVDEVSFEDVVSVPSRDDFLISALPMTKNVDELIVGYQRISDGRKPSDDEEIASCIFHDLVNYGIETGLTKTEFVHRLAVSFFSHPFIQKIDEFIAPEAYFGRIKEWVQNNCTDVPVPSRRELTGNVQVLLEWFVRLGNEKYIVDIPNKRSQRIRNTKYEN